MTRTRSCCVRAGVMRRDWPPCPRPGVAPCRRPFGTHRSDAARTPRTMRCGSNLSQRARLERRVVDRHGGDAKKRPCARGAHGRDREHSPQPCRRGCRREDGRAERSTRRTHAIDRASINGSAIHGVRTAATHAAQQHPVDGYPRRPRTMKQPARGVGLVGIFKNFSNRRDGPDGRAFAHAHARRPMPISPMAMRPARQAGAPEMTLALRLARTRPPPCPRYRRKGVDRVHDPARGRAMQQSRTTRSDAGRPRRSVVPCTRPRGGVPR
jgi:hypothetical protein